MDVFVSHAQNYEDVRLWNALQTVHSGTYVDIGAHDPDEGSVTRAFYDRGWSGINIEPVTAYYERLQRARTRDVNLQVAATASEGEVVLFEIPDSGLSTLCGSVAERHRAEGFQVVRTLVRGRPLRDVWAEFIKADVHFLKVDVEGAEGDVLAGADLAQQRPWVIVIEAFAPLTSIATHAQWESSLTTAGYRFVHSDGLNRYYVAEERGELAEPLRSAPYERGDVVRASELIASRPEHSRAGSFDPTRSTFLGFDHPIPTLRSPTSQLCTENQLREPVYRAWCEAFGEPPIFNRKQWEFAYLLQVLAVHGMLEPGRRGLGFGCGREPLAAVMARRGCDVLATDQDKASGVQQGWVETEQHAGTLEELNSRGLCEPDLFRQRVHFRTENMNDISPDLEGFDFVWSSCAFEHLGSIRHGLEFVVNAMRCLKAGGVAVHTTEFNLGSNYRTIERADLVVFRRYDIEQLIGSLDRRGYAVAPLNLNPGSGPIDRYVDLPPYHSEPHLRLRMHRHVFTSLGLIVRKPA